jgi:excisionase family DNA binding protein
MMGDLVPSLVSQETRAMSETIPNKCQSVEQVAEYLGVVPLTVRRLIKARKLRASKVARRVVIRPADLDAYLDANPAVRS